MRHLFILLLVGSSTLVSGQIRGNGELTTKRFALGEVQELLININATIEIDAAANDNYIEITTDENLIEYLVPENDNGKVELSQKEWVKPKRGLSYVIGSTDLQVLKNDSWADVRVDDLSQEYFRYQSLVGGEAVFTGQVNEFRLALEGGNINASELIAQNAFVNIWDDAQALITVVQELHSEVSHGGRLMYTQEPAKVNKKTKAGGQVYHQAEHDTKGKKEEVEFITFKIKSKGTEIIQAYVKGPNGRGGTFSYGLPIRPFTPKKETWSVGTKLYSVNKMGIKTLIYTVKKEDAGKVITVSKK
ncbi:MAG: DUF2807 domain-containing protein [Saprospiraceae bacterium]|nr:DUF2807 domain-containing protein [Saprospiraceae bacterium]